MAIVRDASSPARWALGTATGTESGSSGSFTPPAGAEVRVYVAVNSAVSATPTFNVPTFSGSSLTFTLLKSQVNAAGGSSAVFRGRVGASPTAGTISVSITTTGGGSVSPDAAAWASVWTGAASDQTGAATFGQTSTSTTFNLSLTTTRAGVQVEGCAIDWGATGNPTSSDTVDAYTVAGQTSGALVYKTVNSGAAGAVALNFVAGGAGPQWTGVTAEIFPALSAVPVNPSYFHPGKGPGLGSNRFYQSRKAYNVQVATQSFSYTSTGGLQFGGSGTEIRAHVLLATGGLIFAGTGTPLKKVVFLPTSGLVFGGTATYSNTSSQTFTYTATGGLVFGGTGTELRKIVFLPTNGIVFGGTATKNKGFSYTPTGGLVFSGTITEIKKIVVVATSGLVFGGSASVQFVTAGAVTALSTIRRFFSFLKGRR